MDKSPWNANGARKVTKKEALSSMLTCRQAAHCMIYSPSSHVLFGAVDMRYNVMIAMRFDGTFGFPGGFVNLESRVETIESGLNRELYEEINLHQKFGVSEADYLSSYVQELGKGKKLINHFYVKSVSEEEFSTIEKGCLTGIEWGKETLGMVRVPVQNRDRFDSFYRKNPPIVEFLQHKFVGNAKQELIEGLIHAGIFTHDEMLHHWNNLPEARR